MTRVNSEQNRHTPWFAKAGAACSIVPIARFVGPNIFALKGGGYATFSTKPKDRVRRSKLIEKYGLTEGITRFAQGETV